MIGLEVVAMLRARDAVVAVWRDALGEYWSSERANTCAASLGNDISLDAYEVMHASLDQARRELGLVLREPDVDRLAKLAADAWTRATVDTEVVPR